MEFTKQSFDRCLFNPLESGFWHKSDRLKKVGPEKMVTYLIMMYDPASPLRQEFQDLRVRKEEAALLSEFKPDKDSAATVVGTINFLKVVNNHTWSNIVSIEFALWEQRQRLLTPIEFGIAGTFDKETMSAVNMKGTTADSIIELTEKLEKLYDKFYGHDPELKKEAAEVVVIDMSPQKMARMLKGE